MNGLIRYFIKFPLAANLLMVAIFIMGIIGLKQMKSTFFPNVESNVISIQVVYPGSSPEEIEEGIVKKIEENLKGVTGVDRTTSISQENSGSVSIEVQKGYDVDLILQDVKNAVDRISSFPDAMEPPVIFKREAIGFAFSFALSGPVSLQKLKEVARQVEDEILAIDGISKVALSGFPDEEIEIAFRESDLRTYQLTFQQATQAVRAANLELSGGTIKTQDEELLLRAKNKKYYANELRNIVVKNAPNGNIIRLSQVADIRDKWVDNPNRSYLNGQSSVVVTVSNTNEEDLITVAEKSLKYMNAFNDKNDVVKANLIRDGSDYVLQRVDLLTRNGIAGFIIVCIFLALFLNWRLAFWVAIAIPISFAGMFICISYLGVTINIISLFAMILVIGILVDDGIVIGENIYQFYEKGMDREEAAIQGTLAVLPAVFSAIVTTIIVFMAFFFLDGRIGDFFSNLASVVIFCLLFSLIEGALILPAHIAHSQALNRDLKKSTFTKGMDKVMAFMRDQLYAPVLRASMNYKGITLSLIVGLFIITIGAIQGGLVKQTFFPNVEFDNFDVNLKMPAGTRENITIGHLDNIEKMALELNDEIRSELLGDSLDVILNIEKKIGPSTYEGKVSFALLDAEKRGTLKTSDVFNKLRDKVGTIPGSEQLTFGIGGAFGKPITISLVSENQQELKQAAEELKSELNQLAETRDIIDNNAEGLREINISLKEKAYYLGLNLQTVVSQVRQGYFGSEIQRLQRGRDEVKVWVRYDEADRSSINDLNNMRIRFADGREFPLNEIADLEMKRGVIAINHINGKREIKIEGDLKNNNLTGEVNANINENILPAIFAKYPSVQSVAGGQERENAKTGRSFAAVGPVVLLMMFFVIALTFRSISQTVIVFLLVPFLLVGVAWGHYFLDKPISLLSNLGVFALIGILVNDALVFVTTYNQKIAAGEKQMDAIYNTGVNRFRPIILTSITTIAGLLPLLLEKSVQAQFLIPMAISLAFGLMFITVVILILLPVLLIMSNRFKYYASWAWNGQAPTFEAVEAASEENGGYGYLWTLMGIIAVWIFVLMRFKDSILSFFQ